MYGDKLLVERLDIVGPKGQTIPNAKVNLAYYINESEFRELFYERRMTYRQIAETIDYPYDLSNFSRLVRAIGWKDEVGGLRKYTTDETFFSKLTRESAWVYGWILTDGHVSDKYFDIKLQNRDLDVLYKIKSAIKYTGDLYLYDKYSGLRIYNRNIVATLVDVGLPLKNKTFDCQFPEELGAYAWDFMRGLFEGDGNAQIRKGNLRVTICGASEHLMRGISEFLTINGVVNAIKETKPNFYVVTASDMGSAMRWLYFMYNNTTSDIRMDRKYCTYISFVRDFYDHKRYVSNAIELVELARQTIPEFSDA